MFNALLIEKDDNGYHARLRTIDESRLPDGEVRLGGVGHLIGDQIADLCQAETRVTILGHVQRGGQPVAWDRLMAAAFGVRAVELLAEGKSDRMVAWLQRTVTDVSIAEVVDRPHPVDPQGPLVGVARGLGICLGDQVGWLMARPA